MTPSQRIAFLLRTAQIPGACIDFDGMGQRDRARLEALQRA